MSSEQEIHEGNKVAWNWGRSHAEGTVQQVATHKLEKDIKGKHVTRKGDENPALEIKSSKSGTPVVKRVSECHKLDEHEEVDSHEHVDTRRQRDMEQSRQG